LSDAGWDQWQERERTAVTRVLEAMWAATMSSYPGSRHPGGLVVADALLCGLGRAFRDVDPLLRAWAGDPRLTARLHLRDVILCNAKEFRTGKLGNPWWRDVPTTMAGVAGWLRSGPANEALLAALDQTDGEERDLFQMAFDVAAYP
jgi:hypothetical protein